MPRPFKKGIACHGSMLTHPFSPDRFVDLDNDEAFVIPLLLFSHKKYSSNDTNSLF